MSFTVRPVPELPDVQVITPRVFSDDRGSFLETWRVDRFAEIGLDATFVQDNQSSSSHGVLRGLHYQLPPAAQGKLVRVAHGEVFDVAVDLRRSSDTFGRWTGMILSEETNEMLWIPEGFAHGFLVMSAGAVVVYRTTATYDPDAERAVRWDDPDVGIEWPEVGGPPTLSPKDAAASSLGDADIFP